MPRTAEQKGWLMTKEHSTAAVERIAITVCLILSVLMQALDTTIANVALPYMQGSVAASQDEIAWVLTSYIVAAAIMTPPTGFLAGRFGIRRVLQVSIFGFIVSSMLCGAAHSLAQIVAFRVMQGVFGASLVPLAQTVLFGMTTRERQGRAMGLFGMAVMTGPVLGPVLGGWLTENLSWRYVFYINLPIGILAFTGISIFLKESNRNRTMKLDWLGFGTLSLGIGALQVMLDRGEEMDWFSSKEIIIEAVVAGTAFYLFLVQTFTARQPFLKPSMFVDRNFAAGTLFVSIVGMTYYSSLALQPPYLQDLMNYPIVTAGLVMGPRGIGTMATMLFVGRLIGKIDTRLLLSVGLATSAWSFFEMTTWNPAVSEVTVIGVGLVQGIGLGFLFVPLSTATLSTLSTERRAEGAGIFSLSRNIGSSIGISVVNSLLTRNTQINHAEIIPPLTPFDRSFEISSIAKSWSPTSAAGRASLDAVIGQQAQIIAYIDDYKLLMIAIIAAIPLLMVFKPLVRAPALADVPVD